MSRDESRQLRTLERLRNTELEAAQVEYAAREVHVDRCRDVVEKYEARTAQAEEFVRGQLARAERLSVETLDAFARFAREQADLLCEAREALQRALDEAAKAHRSVVEHFERLSVVERLRERRAMDAGRDVARTEQKRLDDQALIRLAAELAGSTSKSNEE